MMTSNHDLSFKSMGYDHGANPAGVKSFSLGCSAAQPQEWNPPTQNNPARGDTHRKKGVAISELPQRPQVAKQGNSVASAKPEFGSPSTTEPNPAGVKSFNLGCSAVETQVWNLAPPQNPDRGDTHRKKGVAISELPQRPQVAKQGNSVASAKQEFGSPFPPPTGFGS